MGSLGKLQFAVGIEFVLRSFDWTRIGMISCSVLGSEPSANTQECLHTADVPLGTWDEKELLVSTLVDNNILLREG